MTTIKELLIVIVLAVTDAVVHVVVTVVTGVVTVTMVVEAGTVIAIIERRGCCHRLLQ